MSVYLCKCPGGGLLSRGRDQASVQLSSSLLPRMCCWSITRQRVACQGSCFARRKVQESTFGIPPEADSFVTRAWIAICSLHLHRRGSERSAPCVSCLSPAPIAVALGTVTATALSTSSTVVLSASDLSPRRRTLHSHHHSTHVNTGRTANTTSTHFLTNAWSYTVTRSCRSSHEAWQQ